MARYTSKYQIKEVQKFSAEGIKTGQNALVTFKIVETATGKTVRRGYKSVNSAYRAIDRMLAKEEVR